MALPETASIADLATLLGVTHRHVSNLLTVAGVKSVSRGQVAFAPAIRGLLASARASREVGALSAARTRQVNARAAAIELANDVANRTLVPVEDSNATVDFVAGVVRAEMQGLPARLTRDVKERRRIDAEVTASLARIADALDAAAASLETGQLPGEDEAA